MHPPLGGLVREMQQMKDVVEPEAIDAIGAHQPAGTIGALEDDGAIAEDAGGRESGHAGAENEVVGLSPRVRPVHGSHAPGAHAKACRRPASRA
jgi:hypothetical protein